MPIDPLSEVRYITSLFIDTCTECYTWKVATMREGDRSLVEGLLSHTQQKSWGMVTWSGNRLFICQGLRSIHEYENETKTRRYLLLIDSFKHLWQITTPRNLVISDSTNELQQLVKGYISTLYCYSWLYLFTVVLTSLAEMTGWSVLSSFTASMVRWMYGQSLPPNDTTLTGLHTTYAHAPHYTCTD